MKLSDKALRLIGRKVLGSMDKTANQDGSKLHRDKQMPAGNTTPRLNLQTPLKAPILPFRNRKPEP